MGEKERDTQTNIDTASERPRGRYVERDRAAIREMDSQTNTDTRSERQRQGVERQDRGRKTQVKIHDEGSTAMPP